MRLEIISLYLQLTVCAWYHHEDNYFLFKMSLCGGQSVLGDVRIKRLFKTAIFRLEQLSNGRHVPDS